jgi:hypothetical protein
MDIDITKAVPLIIVLNIMKYVSTSLTKFIKFLHTENFNI